MFLDTNVLVSAFATRGVCADLLRVVLSEHTLVTGEVVLKELKRVLRTRMRMPAELVSEIERFLREQEVAGTPVAPSDVRIRDEDDRWVLASAVEAKVDCLVTGDRDLLEAAAKAPIEIIDPRGFWEKLRSG